MREIGFDIFICVSVCDTIAMIYIENVRFLSFFVFANDSRGPSIVIEMHKHKLILIINQRKCAVEIPKDVYGLKKPHKKW